MGSVIRIFKTIAAEIRDGVMLGIALLGLIKIDLLIAVILSYAYKFLVTIISPDNGVYYSADYVVFGCLIYIITFRFKMNKCKPNSVYSIISIIIIIITEAINYNMRKAALDDLDFVRHILYNPMIMPTINAILFGLYLGMLSDPVKTFYARSGIDIIIFFSLFYIIFWLAVYSDIFPVGGLARNNYLNNNHLSYACLFCAYSTYRHNAILQFSNNKKLFIYIISSIIIIVNTTRGAVVCAILYALVEAFNRWGLWGIISKLKINAVSIVIVLMGVVAFFIFQTDQEPVTTEYGFYDGELVEEIMSSLDNIVLDLNNLEDIEINRDSESHSDGVISSASRFFTNYIGLMYFFEYPIVGIGTALAYSIKVLGEGIHSFIFLYIASFGILGIYFLLLSILYLYKSFSPSNSTDLRGLGAAIVFAVPILVFLNYIPLYAVIFLCLESRVRSQRVLQSSIHEMQKKS
jgi:hypothetical protein